MDLRPSGMPEPFEVAWGTSRNPTNCIAAFPEVSEFPKKPKNIKGSWGAEGPMNFQNYRFDGQGPRQPSWTRLAESYLPVLPSPNQELLHVLKTPAGRTSHARPGFLTREIAFGTARVHRNMNFLKSSPLQSNSAVLESPIDSPSWL
jgi:hypothetical protein